jgi:hypothetical protein
MRQKPASRARSFTLLTVLASTFALLGGCSFLYDLDGEQCSVDGDCDKLGGQLAGRLCVDGLCVAKSANQGGSAGSGGSSGSSSGGTAGTSQSGCTEHTDCIDKAEGLPAVCEEGTCITLVNGAEDGACTVVLGREHLDDNEDVFVFGAFSAVPNPQQPLSSPITLNFKYVIEEIADAGGMKIRGKDRYPVAVVCDAANADSESLDRSFDHLVDRVGVPAIISSLYALELKRSFERVHVEKGKDVFFLSPFESDSVLTKLDDGGQLWHLLPDSLSVAPAYLPLFERIESKVSAERGTGDGAGGAGGAGGADGAGGAGGESRPLKVALIQNDFQWLSDVATYLYDELAFNGLPAKDAGNDENFLVIEMESAELNGPDDGWVEDVEDLLAFKPDIIVSAAGSEFYQVMEALESEWGSDFRPYYVLSPFQYGVELTTLVDSEPTLRERVTGINTASAEDKSLYDDYLRLFKAANSDVDPPSLLNGTENFYDAALFTLLAASGAANPPKFTGADVARGMARLVDTAEGTPADLTLDKVKEYAERLSTDENASYALTGTLGPPNFNIGFGTRKGSGSVWCVSSGPEVRFDVLRYDPEGPTLTGDFPCFDLPEP